MILAGIKMDLTSLGIKYKSVGVFFCNLCANFSFFYSANVFEEGAFIVEVYFLCSGFPSYSILKCFRSMSPTGIHTMDSIDCEAAITFKKNCSNLLIFNISSFNTFHGCLCST